LNPIAEPAPDPPGYFIDYALARSFFEQTHQRLGLRIEPHPAWLRRSFRRRDRRQPPEKPGIAEGSEGARGSDAF
jgi:hypothetical protein